MSEKISDAVSNDTPDPFPSPSPRMSIAPSVPTKGGEGGGHQQVSNSAFMAVVFRHIPKGASAAVCTKGGDPTSGGWHASVTEAGIEALSIDMNNYLNCSSFTQPQNGSFNVRKDNFSALHFILLDDLGGKVGQGKLGDFELSWLIETSPGNYQGGIMLADPITDVDEAERLQKAVLAAGLGDEGASGVTRWARLPNAINGKEKYKTDGKPFQCRLVEWRPERRYTPREIVSGLRLEMAGKKEAITDNDSHDFDHGGDHVFTPSALENPVIGALRQKGLYKTPLGSGKHDITCPWVHEHTDALDSGTAYFEPNEDYPIGGFVCLHSHRDRWKTKEFYCFLGIEPSVAMNKPTIRVHQGELHSVIAVAEKELARQGKHFQSGGLIVSIDTDTNTGETKILPTNTNTMTRELSVIAKWEKFDRRSQQWHRCDPPQRHVSILHDLNEYRHLPPLSGLARQPYFQGNDGGLVTEPGYDKLSKIFGVFDPRQFKFSDPTMENARQAMNLLTDLLMEFRFVTDADKSAALSALFTATVRPSLPHAPGFHVRAPASGSGKTYLCELIGAFAGPAGNAKVSYPKSSDEASKVLLSLLLANPAVIEFDDMDSDWVPHGVINRALTAEKITERILGVSKTATVSTRTLFLGSGNNVGPVRDLMRRVLTIHIDPRCSSPATIRYASTPVDEVRNNRGRYVSAVLMIIDAWRKAGSPRADVESIATYGGVWAEYCRHPLMWLGYPDPATSLLQQVNHDPDTESLGRLMVEWKKEFGSAPTTVRKVLDVAMDNEDLMDALREFPIEERGGINRSKFGWVLKKNANRIVGGLEFRRAEADGRTAWRVVEADFPRHELP